MDEGLATIRHDRSKRDFPTLKLEDDEYVEYAFKRARVSLFLTLAGLGLGMIAILFVFLILILGQEMLDTMAESFLHVIIAILMAAMAISMAFTWMIYRGNRLFVTNKHVIQMVMISPMASSLNVIDLSSIEDASYSQSGLMEKIFGYGTFRLSTVGDETTYTFRKSDVTPDELRAISKLISEAKKRQKDDK